jgi:UDPglucose 6-dehydrogenase|tara:strand:+ start:1209 stop:2057 length:849 start_codon:yes stop_codon:yes gene_type:complete
MSKPKIGVIGNGFVGSAIVGGFSLVADVMVHDNDALRTTHSLKELVTESEYIFVSVPTPMKKSENNKMDLTIMDNVIENISKLSSSTSSIVILKSTILPRTTEKYAKKYKNIDFVFCPEFLTERTARLDFINSSRIIIGTEKDAVADKVENMLRVRFPYTKIIKTDSTTAEFIKYMNNCFFAAKISIMNEFYQASVALDVDWDKALDGFLSDGRVGNSHLDVPGHDGQYGFGGKCFPKDINAFINLFVEIGISPTMLEAAWEKNMEVRDEHDWESIIGATSQ